jgi:hypothetical protein
MNPKLVLLPKSRNLYRKGMFSACCLVTDWKRYEEHCRALADAGFDEHICEYLICDNTARNEFDAFEAIRLFMACSKGEYILIAHQDTAPLERADKLMSLIHSVETHDPLWGVIGNAGKTRDKPIEAAMHIDMPGQRARISPPFMRVDSLDENVLIVRNGTGITVSSSLSGFHFYGADICLIADRLGYASYVTKFLWQHDSKGTLNDNFFELKHAFETQLHRHCAKNSLPTTCTVLCWSGSPHSRGKAAALAAEIRKENRNRSPSCPAALFWNALYTLIFRLRRTYLDLTRLPRSAVSRMMGDLHWWRKNWKSRLPAGRTRSSR